MFDPHEVLLDVVKLFHGAEQRLSLRQIRVRLYHVKPKYTNISFKDLRAVFNHFKITVHVLRHGTKSKYTALVKRCAIKQVRDEIKRGLWNPEVKVRLLGPTYHPLEGPKP